jgi:hypothetical protein
MARSVLAFALVSLVATLAPSGAYAQPLGTFKWQLQSFCNVLSLVVTQSGSVFTLDGFDDQCGATTRAPVTGLATPNPNGTIEFGLTIVATPGAAPVHVAAAISMATLGGTWRDSTGATGNFVFTPGNGTGGSPRPASSGIPSTIKLFPDGGFVAGGALNTGSIPASGLGTRMMWYPGKAAFRAGHLTIPAWDQVNIGLRSVAFGLNTVASGDNSAAFGEETRASAVNSAAFGYNSQATSPNAFALGTFTLASGVQSFAAGTHTEASGAYSAAFGTETRALGTASLAAGVSSIAEGVGSVAMGRVSYAGGTGSVALGSHAIASTSAHGSFVFADQSSDNNFVSLAANEFGVRAAGGVFLYTRGDLGTGCTLPAGSGTWACTSDRNSKEHFEPVDGALVLTKLRAMPIERWSYRSEPGVSHVGPVAQDFYAAFGLGTDEKTVGHLDLSGIGLRAIQELDARAREQEDAFLQENNALRLVIDALKQDVAALRERLDRLTGTQQ